MLRGSRSDHVDCRDGVAETERQRGDRPMHAASLDLRPWLRDARVFERSIGSVWSSETVCRCAARRDERVAQHRQVDVLA